MKLYVCVGATGCTQDGRDRVARPAGCPACRVVETDPAPAPAETTTEFWVNCGNCRHHWIAAWLPMKIDDFVRVTSGLHCPRCAHGPGKIFCGTAPAEQKRLTSV